MPKLLVFQHVAHEILGTLDPLLRNHGFRNRYVNFGREPHTQPRLEGYHGMVILGGPMNVDQIDEHPHLVTEVRLVREAIEREMPILGICLGSQLLAKALGAPVRANPRKEIGWYEVERSEAGRTDPLFRHLRDVEPVFQWHGDTFDLPEGAVHLASSRLCTNQAFRYGDRAYGLQFHLEVDGPLIERWLGIPAHQEEMAAEDDRISPERIRDDTPRYSRDLVALSERVFSEWIGLFGALRRRGAGPHA